MLPPRMIPPPQMVKYLLPYLWWPFRGQLDSEWRLQDFGYFGGGLQSNSKSRREWLLRGVHGHSAWPLRILCLPQLRILRINSRAVCFLLANGWRRRLRSAIDGRG